MFKKQGIKIKTKNLRNCKPTCPLSFKIKAKHFLMCRKSDNTCKRFPRNLLKD